MAWRASVGLSKSSEISRNSPEFCCLTRGVQSIRQGPAQNAENAEIRKTLEKRPSDRCLQFLQQLAENAEIPDALLTAVQAPHGGLPASRHRPVKITVSRN